MNITARLLIPATLGIFGSAAAWSYPNGPPAARTMAPGDRPGQACTVCHGDDLNGVGSVPPIAARSPSYIARQLYDFQQGSRHGDMADLMKKVAANLTNDDMVNITAYLASLPAPVACAASMTAPCAAHHSAEFRRLTSQSPAVYLVGVGKSLYT